MTRSKLFGRVRVPLGLVFTAAFLVLARPTWASILLSVPPVVGGLWLRGYASGYIRKRMELATTGPYAYTRNPLYLGSMLIAFGFAAASTRWLLAATLAALFLAVYLPTILNEERYLRGRFPEFDAYTRAVPRLIPRLTPADRSEEGKGGFSRNLYLKHREYNALIGVAATYAALVVRILWSGAKG